MLTPLLNTALLGTTKQPYRPDAATPAALQTAWAALADSSAERRTYRYAALAFACAYGGQTPAQSADGWQLIPPAPAAEETLPPEAVAILGGWFKQKRQHLLLYAFARLRAHDLALPTALLPETIAHAQKHPADITDCLLGARGRWLFAEAGLRQNSAADADEDWQLLPFAARKDWLTRLRHEAPDQAREQLAALWSSAPANHRQDYIAILADNLTAADQPFLTAALKDRSKTVKESAHRLLMRLPDSAPVQQHLAWLRERLVWQDAGGWQYLDAPYTAEMKAAGIEQISPDKKESDDDYILRQLILALPLDAWAEVLHTDAATAATILATHRPLLRNLHREDWVDSMDDPRFTRAILTARWPQLPDDIRHRLLARLTPAEREVVLATPGLDHGLLSRSYNNSEIFDPAQPWGPLYSRAVFEGILHSTLLKKYGSTNDAERCAVCLDTRATADTIAALPAHPAFMDSTFLDALHQYAGEKQTFLDLLDSQS